MTNQSYEIYTPTQRPVGEQSVADRSVSPASRPRHHYRHGMCGGYGSVSGFLTVSAITIAVWLMTGGGYFWPMWAMLGTGIPALLSLTRRLPF